MAIIGDGDGMTLGFGMVALVGAGEAMAGDGTVLGDGMQDLVGVGITGDGDGTVLGDGTTGAWEATVGAMLATVMVEVSMATALIEDSTITITVSIEAEEGIATIPLQGLRYADAQM